MIIRDFKGYQEGRDITKIPPEYFAYPTQNVLVYKGKAYKRPGVLELGAIGTNTKIHGEYVWKDAQPGEVAVRTTGQKVQAWLEPFKTGAGWTDIFTALDAAVERVRFATWVDGNGSTVHTRLFFVDGSEDLYQWNGAIGVVDSVASNTITLVSGKTGEALGFDDGSVTNQTIIVNGTTYLYNNNPTGQDLVCTTTPTGVNPGDLVIAQPTVSTTTLTGFKKDHIYEYKNHLVLGNLESGQLYFSHIATYPLDYTVPVPASRTAATPFFATLDGNVTAMAERKDKFWVSTQDDWFKFEKLDTVNAYDLYVEIDKNETTERNGALPYAVTNFKGDTMFMAQDKTLQMITDSDLIQEDSIKLLSDEIALLLQRLDLSEVRLVSHERYIYIIAPKESTLIMYDTVDNEWQPPQVIGMGLMSIIEGKLCGHSNATDTSFEMFRGRQDLGVDFDAVFAPGYIDMDNEFIYKQFTKTAISGRTTKSATIKWETLYEAEGDKASLTRTIDASTIKLFEGNTLTPFGSAPFGAFPFAGASLEDNSDVKRFFLFDGGVTKPFFEYRPVLTVSGENVGFELTAYMVEESAASRKVGNDHYVKT